MSEGPHVSRNEVKPLNLIQRLLEHFGVTHVVDFSAGSGTIAIAAAGAQDYEGITGHDEHRVWLDATLDKCVMHMAGQDEEFTKNLGVDDDAVTENIAKCVGDTMMEARRILTPPDEDEQDDAESSSDGDDSDDA